MAQRVITQLVDDIDGTELVESDGETVLFALDGQTYEIDLSTSNADKLRKALDPYVTAGRRAGRATPRPGAKRSQSGPSAAEIRGWARSNGFDVPDRGRIPQEVRDAFDKR
jgi:hypothetical protein